MSAGVAMASLPDTVRKTIQNIKEITGADSEEEVYAMLKECSMDPNETTQKLLLQDTFHEVKRKRDKKKEIVTNREPGELRSRPGIQGRSRGVRGNYSPRFTSHDAGSSRISSGKLTGINQVAEKGATLSSLPTSQETNKEMNSLTSSVAVMPNGPTNADARRSGTENVLQSRKSAKRPEVTSFDIDKFRGAPPLPCNVTAGLGHEETHEHPTHKSSNPLASKISASPSVACFSSPDPVVLPYHDSQLAAAVSSIKREAGIQQTLVEPDASAPAESKLADSTSEIGSSIMQGEMPSKPQGVGKNQLIESLNPSPGHSNRPQQVVGPQKVHGKEWKPKLINSNPTQGCGTVDASEVLTTSVGVDSCSDTVSVVLNSEETSEVQRKLEELHLPARKHSDQQHVIIPNHIHVPESERTKFSFGSIDAWCGLSTNHANVPDGGITTTPSSETSQGFEETAEEQSSSNQNALEDAEEGDYNARPQSPTQIVENLSSVEGDISSSAVPDCSNPHQETALPPEGHQYSVVHSSLSYSIGFVPPMLGNQIAPFERTDSQGQQPFDLTNCYAPLYRSNVESNGRISPFHSPEFATKYNGNFALLPAQASQSSQEGGNSIMVGPTPLVTQSSIALTQQPVPVFRQPTGYYPPNYIPYGHYISPFFVPPPSIHQFLSNSALPQQPQASMYPPPPGVKYAISQYRPGTNMSNPNPIGMPSSYGSYGSSAANYNPSSDATTGNTTGNEDPAASQLKESNVYVNGQQREGSAVWIAAPGRDIPSLQASSFYGLPPQGHHMTFAPAQTGHGAFSSIYHPLLQPSHTVAGATDMGAPTANVFQQPQHPQINWPNSY